MDFSSTLYFMAINQHHVDFSQMAYNSDQPIYVWKDNTVYKRMGIWCRDFRNWLSDNGVRIDNEERVVYVPVAHVENNVLTGWCSYHANFANRLLDFSKEQRERDYPNLYFVQVGNHPYPKLARYNTVWLTDMFHRECHRIIHPPSDPKDYFILPKDILPK